ncbi:MAG: hypothetical protein FWD31_15200 [Planctomycetaceae bacterium]|nr:hypothetical protein [Planctomycetaceae bacterium]
MTSSKTYIGIDPGKHGAVAVLHPDHSGFVWDFELKKVSNNSRCETRLDGLAFRKMISQVRGVVVLEKTHGYGTKKKMDVFSMGETRGVILGILDGCRIPVIEVTPQQWKKHFGLQQDKVVSDRDRKEAGRQLALRLLPQFKEHLSRKRDHDRADALLIALYAKEKGL